MNYFILLSALIFVYLSVGNDKKTASGLLAKSFYAINYPMPAVFVSGIRSGEIIRELAESAEISCKYDPSSGIFEPYPIKSWKALLGSKEFSGVGTILPEEFIEAINHADSNDVLKLTVELGRNETGYKSSEAVFLLK